MKQSEQRSLILTALAVTVVHLVLLLGWPHWKFAKPVGKMSMVIATRSITPMAVPVPTPAPEPPAPVEPAPTFEAKDAAPTPRPAPRPRPKAAPKPVAPSPEAPSAPMAREAQSLRDGSDIEAPPDFIAGPANYWVNVEQVTSRLEDVMVNSVMADHPGPAVLLPRSVEIRYVTAGTRQGVAYSGVPATLRWSQNNTHYDLRWGFFSTAAGDHRRFNRGVLTPQGLAPVALMNIVGQQREEWRFDYANKRVVGAIDQPTVEFKPGTQDGFSLAIQLAAMAAAQPKELTLGAQLRVPMLEAGSIQDVTFIVTGEETLSALESKWLKTVHLVYQAPDSAQPSIEVWLAPSLDYLPARWRITEANGDTQDRLAQKAIELQPMPSSEGDSPGIRVPR